MRFLLLILSLVISSLIYSLRTTAQETNNIYKIREQIMEHLPQTGDSVSEQAPEDDDRTKFERWYQFVRTRCYPSGNLPAPDVILKAYEAEKINSGTANKITNAHTWLPIGPMNVPAGYNGIGRVNCIVINPNDTNTLYVGTAGGGLFISHNGGQSWSAGTDDFPCTSIADIVLNPHNTDTIYAATGDGYGYESSSFEGFWGGLYSAGVMMSTDGGNSWQTTGLSYLQTDNDIIQKLLIHPVHSNILLAATRHGVMRSTDAGVTWQNVAPGNHIYSMAFMPQHPDTVYATNDSDLLISYDAGQSWQLKYTGINTANIPNKNRASIAVSDTQPNSLWILNNEEDLMLSTNGGNSFIQLNSPNAVAGFYGYYDNVLAIQPAVQTDIFACGFLKTKSTNGGATWQQLDNNYMAHVDNHAISFNPQNPNTIYVGNDGGVFVSHDGGDTWDDLSNGLMISQIYRIASSRQNPYLMLCGLQDNSTFRYDGLNWTVNIDGDGQACAIDPLDDNIQIGSYQYGNFYISYDQGINFYDMSIAGGYTGGWTSPVVFDPIDPNNIYVGLTGGVYASYDQGSLWNSLNTGPAIFQDPGVTSLAISASNPNVIYASDDAHIFASTNQGGTWTDITGNLPTNAVAISHIAVDYTDPQRIYVSTSGYEAGKKVFMSNVGGNSWVNISDNLPNLPANCVLTDSSTKGALFVATDLGVYYRDSSLSSWIKYGTSLPNVMVTDLDINYTNYKIRAATYGRGVWESDLTKPLSVPGLSKIIPLPVKLFPNPASGQWQLMFAANKPTHYSVTVRDITGRSIYTQTDNDIIDASTLAKGIYVIEIAAGDAHSYVKGIKE